MLVVALVTVHPYPLPAVLLPVLSLSPLPLRLLHSQFDVTKQPSAPTRRRIALYSIVCRFVVCCPTISNKFHSTMTAATVAAISTVPGILPMAVAIIATAAATTFCDSTTLCDSTTVLLFLRFWIPAKLLASRFRKPIQFDTCSDASTTRQLNNGWSLGREEDSGVRHGGDQHSCGG